MNKEERNVTDNLKGIEYEKAGDIDKAIEIYEKVVSRKFDGSHPYDRLSILYRKRGDFASEEAVLNKAIAVFTMVAKSGRCDGPKKLLRYQKRLETVHKKMNK
ncbi:MAG: tetratricopeptide repeat protein [Ruminococcus flavefaciens]|nr:tetratricopeptide repeat protein [Eubacterium sp.]MCM1236919.1 tetratricopeptide repeat protein [Ruminococcus flavefaciens]